MVTVNDVNKDKNLALYLSIYLKRLLQLIKIYYLPN